MPVIVATDQDFKEQLESNEKVIVKYFAGWCGQCRLFAPKYRRLADDPRFEGVSFLDVDAEKNPEARKLAGVSNLPFFAVFKGGELVKGDFTSKEEAVVAMLNELEN